MLGSPPPLRVLDDLWSTLNSPGEEGISLGGQRVGLDLSEAAGPRIPADVLDLEDGPGNRLAVVRIKWFERTDNGSVHLLPRKAAFSQRVTLWQAPILRGDQQQAVGVTEGVQAACLLN
jgi:hypothetical protein